MDKTGKEYVEDMGTVQDVIAKYYALHKESSITILEQQCEEGRWWCSAEITNRGEVWIKE